MIVVSTLKKVQPTIGSIHVVIVVPMRPHLRPPVGVMGNIIEQRNMQQRKKQSGVSLISYPSLLCTTKQTSLRISSSVSSFTFSKDDEHRFVVQRWWTFQDVCFNFYADLCVACGIIDGGYCSDMSWDIRNIVFIFDTTRPFVTNEQCFDRCL